MSLQRAVSAEATDTTAAPRLQPALLTVEGRLSQRPSVEDLVDKGVIMDQKIAPAIQQSLKDLERAQLETNLKGKVDRRPELDDVVSRGIMSDPTSVAPGLHAAVKNLEKAKITEQIGKVIPSRPEKDQLVGSGIIPDANVAPSLVQTSLSLQRSFERDALKKQLDQRPGKVELVENNILRVEIQLIRSQSEDAVKQAVVQKQANGQAAGL
ncbi:hypothetical protein BKA69DRAFT_490791 [Paraphysoderma sedebokerense]|nr:hypothetical protein BKA69DRAFT_490791 [Paraphysoderma sedebokerense]